MKDYCPFEGLKEYMNEKFDIMDDKMSDKFGIVFKKQDKQNGRLTALEKSEIERKTQYRILKWGLVTVLGSIATIISVVVAAYFKSKIGL